MTASTSPEPGNAWAAIEHEKRRDRFIRRVSIAAWSTTFVIVLLFGTMVAISVAGTVKLVGAGIVTWVAVLEVAMRFLIVLGILSALIGTLSTVGLFVRMRTVTLSEIQMRLAALEQMLSSRGDAE